MNNKWVNCVKTTHGAALEGGCCLRSVRHETPPRKAGVRLIHELEDLLDANSLQNTHTDFTTSERHDGSNYLISSQQL